MQFYERILWYNIAPKKYKCNCLYLMMILKRSKTKQNMQVTRHTIIPVNISKWRTFFLLLDCLTWDKTTCAHWCRTLYSLHHLHCFLLSGLLPALRRRMLGMSMGIEELGTVRWDLALCLLACWVFCYFSIWKGVRSSGKVRGKIVTKKIVTEWLLHAKTAVF